MPRKWPETIIFVSRAFSGQPRTSSGISGTSGELRAQHATNPGTHTDPRRPAPAARRVPRSPAINPAPARPLAGPLPPGCPPWGCSWAQIYVFWARTFCVWCLLVCRYVLQRLPGPSAACIGLDRLFAGSLTRSTSWYWAFPRLDCEAFTYQGVLKYAEFDFDFISNIRYVPTPVQAALFSAPLGSRLLACRIRMFDTPSEPDFERHSNGVLILVVRSFFTLL